MASDNMHPHISVNLGGYLISGRLLGVGYTGTKIQSTFVQGEGRGTLVFDPWFGSSNRLSTLLLWGQNLRPPQYINSEQSLNTMELGFSDIIILILLITDMYRLKAYFAERQGEREDMQDAHTLIDDLTDDLPNLHQSMSVVIVVVSFINRVPSFIYSFS